MKRMSTSYEEVKSLIRNLKSNPITPSEYATLIADLEKEIAKEVLASDTSIENFSFYQNAYSRVSDLRTHLQSKRLLMIGSGPLPATLFYASQHCLTESCLGIDSDFEAIGLASQLVGKLKIRNVSFKHVDGRDFNYSDFDAVFVANLVKGKVEILNKLEAELPYNATVILRDPWGVGRDIAESARETLGPSWIVNGEGEKCSNFFSQNFFLQLKREQKD